MSSPVSNFAIAVPDDEAMRQVWHILSMRYGLFPREGMGLLGEWFQQNPDETSESLKDHLLSGKILIRDGKLRDLRQISQAQMKQLVALLTGENGVEIKDRWYLARCYPRCFIGQEAVSCIQHTYSISRAEALRLGQLLAENRILRHVLDEHSFKDEALFYRFHGVGA